MAQAKHIQHMQRSSRWGLARQINAYHVRVSQGSSVTNEDSAFTTTYSVACLAFGHINNSGLSQFKLKYQGIGPTEATIMQRTTNRYYICGDALPPIYVLRLLTSPEPFEVA